MHFSLVPWIPLYGRVIYVGRAVTCTQTHTFHWERLSTLRMCQFIFSPSDGLGWLLLIKLKRTFVYKSSCVHASTSLG